MKTPLKVNKLAQLTGHNGSIFSIVPFNPDSFFLSGGGDGWVVSWDMNAPDLGRLIAKVETQIFSLAYLKAAEKVVAGNMNGGIHWIDLNHPTQTKNITHHQNGVFGILPIGERLFSIGGAGLLTEWNISESKSIESIRLTRSSLRSIDYSESRQEIAVGASDNNIYFIDLPSLRLKHIIENAHENSVFVVKYHPNGKQLLSGGRDAHLKAWELEDQYQNTNSLPAHLYTINDLVFHPKGHLVATASRDKTIKIWDSKNLKLLKVLETIRDQNHLNSVNQLYWSNFNNYLVSCSDDRSIIIWEILEKDDSK